MVLPLLVLTWNRKGLRSLVLLGAFGLFAHLILDLFQTSTPLLWPILNQSIWISVMLNFHMGSAPLITGGATVKVEPTVIGRFISFDEPILTAEGLALSLVLLAPTLGQILLSRMTLNWRERKLPTSGRGVSEPLQLKCLAHTGSAGPNETIPEGTVGSTCG